VKEGKKIFWKEEGQGQGKERTLILKFTAPAAEKIRDHHKREVRNGKHHWYVKIFLLVL